MQRSQADLFAAALETPLFRGLPAAFVEHAIAQGYVERFAPGTPVLPFRGCKAPPGGIAFRQRGGV